MSSVVRVVSRCQNNSSEQIKAHLSPCGARILVLTLGPYNISSFSLRFYFFYVNTHGKWNFLDRLQL